MKHLEHYNLNDIFGCIRYSAKNPEATLYTKGTLNGYNGCKKAFQMNPKKENTINGSYKLKTIQKMFSFVC